MYIYVYVYCLFVKDSMSKREKVLFLFISFP